MGCTISKRPIFDKADSGSVVAKSTNQKNMGANNKVKLRDPSTILQPEDTVNCNKTGNFLCNLIKKYVCIFLIMKRYCTFFNITEAQLCEKTKNDEESALNNLVQTRSGI